MQSCGRICDWWEGCQPIAFALRCSQRLGFSCTVQFEPWVEEGALDECGGDVDEPDEATEQLPEQGWRLRRPALR